jgi:diguanylate cyclase (GGDEF)-like protein
VLEAARQTRESGIGKRMEYRVRHKDGSWRVLESEASAVRDAKGEVAKLVIVNRDITDRKRAEEKLEHNLFHDPLTGLPNRRLFLDRLHHSFVRAKRDPERHYALLLANVDHFKVFNERLGTAAGDQVLLEIARRVSTCLRQQDTLARSAHDTVEPVLSRLGGDEFTVLLDAIGDPSDAMRVATRIQSAVAEPLFVEGQEVRISICVGIALGAPAHEQPEEMLKDADTAMRRAKALGGSRCEVFDEAMHTRAIGRMRLEADLRTAITENQFRIHYQPVMRLDSQQVVSLEALLRWEHPSQGLISPNRFLEAAEDTGLMVSIGHWLLLQSCRQLSEWEINLSGNNPVNLTLNVSARQFADARLVNDLQDALQQTGVNPGRLQLEMTESVAAADPRLTMTVLSHLKHMGIGVILDDFGVGSSSLRGLWQFPVDALKIDRSLVREMLTDRAATDIVETIITLGRKMNLRVIAEGIETARQAERLRELGCGYGQGYYFSQPLESKTALQFLRRQGTPARASAAGAEAP